MGIICAAGVQPTMLKSNIQAMEILRMNNIFNLSIFVYLSQTLCKLTTFHLPSSYLTTTWLPPSVFSISMRVGKASFNSSRCVMTRIFAKSGLTVLMASIRR